MSSTQHLRILLIFTSGRSWLHDESTGFLCTVHLFSVPSSKNMTEPVGQVGLQSDNTRDSLNTECIMQPGRHPRQYTLYIKLNFIYMYSYSGQFEYVMHYAVREEYIWEYNANDSLTTNKQ
jgi:hypothetical protein